ncbi:MAG: DUF3822 family protein [Prolixibacteraceae bacterium]|jgi:hypothetical protein
MHELNLIDNSFDLKLASEYHISIQLGLDGFSFCILDIRRSKYIVLRHIPLIVGKTQFLSRKLETLFDQEENLHASFKSVTITYSTTKATLIPKEYSKDFYLNSLASFTNELSRNDVVSTDVIHGFNYQLMYSFPKELMILLNRKFTDFKFRHKSIPLISTAVTQQTESKNSLLINFEKKYIRMVAFKNQQIELYNSFYFKNETDFLYYTLNVWQNLQFDPEHDEVLIGGYVADDSSYIRQIKKYISTIHFLKPSDDFNYGNIFEKVQKHQFISLLNTYSCA